MASDPTHEKSSSCSCDRCKMVTMHSGSRVSSNIPPQHVLSVPIDVARSQQQVTSMNNVAIGSQQHVMPVTNGSARYYTCVSSPYLGMDEFFHQVGKNYDDEENLDMQQQQQKDDTFNPLDNTRTERERPNKRNHLFEPKRYMTSSNRHTPPDFTHTKRQTHRHDVTRRFVRNHDSNNKFSNPQKPPALIACTSNPTQASVISENLSVLKFRNKLSLAQNINNEKLQSRNRSKHTTTNDCRLSQTTDERHYNGTELIDVVGCDDEIDDVFDDEDNICSDGSLSNDSFSSEVYNMRNVNGMDIDNSNQSTCSAVSSLLALRELPKDNEHPVEGDKKTASEAIKTKATSGETLSETSVKKRGGGKLGRRRKRGYIYDPKPLIPKSKTTSLPNNLKDADYWHRRERNNLAAKRSRENRRVKELEKMQEVKFLSDTNTEMKERIKELEDRNEYLEKLLKSSLTDNSDSGVHSSN